MADVKLDHIKKIYQSGVVAVEDTTIEIKGGEFIVLVGPSGCGKSTTLRMIAGLEDITEGHLYIDGKDVTHVPPKDRDIAMVFQNYALYGNMTVYENMAFSLTLRKEDPKETHRKVMAAAKILGLVDQLNKKPRELSGGQRQRVAMGRAIVRNPKVFLFDEPLSNLAAPNTTPPCSSIYSASTVNTPPAVASARADASVLHAAKTAGSGRGSRCLSTGQIWVQ